MMRIEIKVEDDKTTVEVIDHTADGPVIAFHEYPNGELPMIVDALIGKYATQNTQ